MHGRRLAPHSSACGGRVVSSELQTTLHRAELHASALDAHALPSLWGARPLIGEVRPGALRLRCAPEELATVRRAYAGLHLEPLMRAMRPHNGKRPFAPAARHRIALLVLPDYPNLFHQFGSLVVAWAALQDSLRLMPMDGAPGSTALPPAEDVEILLLSNASLLPTASFWSPGLARTAPVFVRASPPLPPATYERIVLVQPATETWWWNVWARDATDRRPVLSPLVSRMLPSLLPPGAPETARAARDWTIPQALVIHRPPPADRRVLNDNALALALHASLAASGGAVRAATLIDLGQLSTRAQLATIRRAGLLVGAHGAGLLWNLFLPEGAAVLEILNARNANAYYANHCLWSRRPYATWQNNDTSLEEPALDPVDGRKLDPFRNHVRVDVAGVVAVARELLLASPARVV